MEYLFNMERITIELRMELSRLYNKLNELEKTAQLLNYNPTLLFAINQQYNYLVGKKNRIIKNQQLCKITNYEIPYGV